MKAVVLVSFCSILCLGGGARAGGVEEALEKADVPFSHLRMAGKDVFVTGLDHGNRNHTRWKRTLVLGAKDKGVLVLHESSIRVDGAEAAWKAEYGADAKTPLRGIEDPKAHALVRFLEVFYASNALSQQGSSRHSKEGYQDIASRLGDEFRALLGEIQFSDGVRKEILALGQQTDLGDAQPVAAAFTAFVRATEGGRAVDLDDELGKFTAIDQINTRLFRYSERMIQRLVKDPTLRAEAALVADTLLAPVFLPAPLRYGMRDPSIGANTARLIEGAKQREVVVLIGDFHRPFLVSYLVETHKAERQSDKYPDLKAGVDDAIKSAKQVRGAYERGEQVSRAVDRRRDEAMKIGKSDPARVRQLEAADAAEKAAILRMFDAEIEYWQALLKLLPGAR